MKVSFVIKIKPTKHTPFFPVTCILSQIHLTQQLQPLILKPVLNSCLYNILEITIAIRTVEKIKLKATSVLNGLFHSYKKVV